MINIRQKTQDEIKKEEGMYRFGAAVLKEIPESVCTTYIMRKDGTRVDTNKLTDDEILILIQSDLMDYVSPHSTYLSAGDLDSFKLAELLRKALYTPSMKVVLQLQKWKEQYGSIVGDLMGSIGANRYIEKARDIAKFQKETSGDFTPVRSDEVLAIIEQMAVNEEIKKNAVSMKI